ncbi:MAG TPA: CRISPR-associated endonuclease Cas2 [Syntrophales bacterium]|nr:CRISPR-associated endonuclease Cas2 [Syntrophales bacterium]HOM08332.1 CRISPR-associated endonuclease Cas2 [Syntrophales bacterium]HOO00955.1 CRISPR-associated endonuclease Cas2 [Syntrophales bacterium]HPC02079.1 CRISPR-associated endonuclease Cas2 [Syntrophales bacterium]HRS88024.1 CRISPR-associated endonuclease Cas2 [Syntrophales bacterium]
MKVIVAYDISDPRRLRRVAKISEDYGTRVQKSIFELDVTVRRLEEMIGRIAEVIEPQEDSVKYFLLCEKCAHRGVEIIGQGVFVDPDAEFYVV